MTDSCVFCRILAGQLPASYVYQDQHTVAFLDIRPVNPGHTLVIPRRHVVSARDLDADEAARLWEVALRVARALFTSGVRIEGLNLLHNDGSSAGQDVFHAHLHVVPRFAGDGFGFRVTQRTLVETTVLDGVAARINAALA